MSEKAKIILIYVVVALICAGVVGTSLWIRRAQEARFGGDPFVAVGKAMPQDFGLLESDLTATNQDGEEVRLSDLKGKVWVATCFFASCPQCLLTSADDLARLYAEFGGDPDFQIVSITVNPEEDTPAQLRAYAKAMGAETRNWWFLRAPKEVVYPYVEKEMKFLRVTENHGPEFTERFSHDRGLQVYARDWLRVKKRDLHYARQQSEALHDAWFNEVRDSIRGALDKKEAEPDQQHE